MDSKKERMRILEHIECGEVSVDEGLRLLQRLSDETEIHETLEVGHDEATNNNTKIPARLLRISRSGTIGGCSLSGSALASQSWADCLCIRRCSQTGSGCGSFSL